MSVYRVRHRTTYVYQQDVVYSRLVTHLAPRPTSRQQVETFAVVVDPGAAKHVDREDYFGNRTDWFLIEEPHEKLDVVAESRVTVAPLGDFSPSETARWEHVRDACELPRDGAALDAMQYVFDTPLTTAAEEATAYARSSFLRGRALFECVMELNSRIHADFKYDSEATDSSTAVEDVFERRAGVCQDFAHVGVAAMRAMGLPARYVSGYLLTHPPPGRERLVGADASHAWFAAWIPPYGWIDFDPTNDMLPSSEHITVAWGRDYSDVAPVHGIITGGSEHEVSVGVDVQPL